MDTIKFIAVRGYTRTIHGKKVKVRAHLRHKHSFWDVFEKTPYFDTRVCSPEEERTVEL